jgi:molybdopterin molybdotransferase/putative molybdopterin biosynthesis protein
MKKRFKDNYPTRGEVMSRLFERWGAPVRTERVRTAEAAGRVLASDVLSLCDEPVCRASRMDGVAVKSASFKDGIPDASGWALGVDYVRADTGDDFDDAFDAVVAIEDVTFAGGGGLVFHPELEPVVAGENVAGRGATLRRGALIAGRGTRLIAADVVAIAMGAVDVVEVYRRPKVVFIPTGSELIPLGGVPARGQKVDCNSVLAGHMLREMGAEAVVYPIARDDPGVLAEALEGALREADVVVLCAGTSKGGEDFSHALLAERGELVCHGVAMAPGKPLAIAIVDGKPVVNVAGPPMACFNGLDWCVRTVVSSFFELGVPVRHTLKARLAERIGDPNPGFELFIRVRLEDTPEGYVAYPVTFGSGGPVDSLRSEGRYITRLKPEPQEKGDVIEVELMRPDW